MLLYLTVMFKPLLPLVGDFASHFFAEAYHEATVHAKYGAHHVDAEIANTGAENDNSKHQNTLKAQEPVPFHIIAQKINYTLSFSSLATIKSSFKEDEFSSLPILVPSPPPKFA
jgi:hypothetical protein